MEKVDNGQHFVLWVSVGLTNIGTTPISKYLRRHHLRGVIAMALEETSQGAETAVDCYAHAAKVDPFSALKNRISRIPKSYLTRMK